MSNSTKIKGRKSSKKYNLLAKLDYPVKMKPYGKTAGNRFKYADEEEHIVPEVNKKRIRQESKRLIKEEQLYEEALYIGVTNEF
jgi:hypothetical protein